MKKAVFLFLPLAVLSVSFQQPFKTQSIEMIKVEGGTFKMGTLDGVKSERPVHEVKINSFFIAQYEVTQQLWQAVMTNNPSYFTNCDSCPVEEVTLVEVDSFIAKLNRATNMAYRLPTEAEWEYAALGGKQSKGYRYPGSNDLLEVGWVVHNGGKKTHPVGQKKPNELGIYDMAGNVWELCQDSWNPDYYKSSPAANPCNKKPSAFRVCRGGSWRSAENRCYSKARNFTAYDHYKKENFGLRLVLDGDTYITLPR